MTNPAYNADEAVRNIIKQSIQEVIQELINAYDEQLVQDACEHEWVESNMYEHFCSKCNMKTVWY